MCEQSLGDCFKLSRCRDGSHGWIGFEPGGELFGRLEIANNSRGGYAKVALAVLYGLDHWFDLLPRWIVWFFTIGRVKTECATGSLGFEEHPIINPGSGRRPIRFDGVDCDMAIDVYAGLCFLAEGNDVIGDPVFCR